jgi:hypothetical protein
MGCSMGCEQPRKQIPSPYVNKHLWGLWHIEKLADAALDFGAGAAEAQAAGGDQPVGAAVPRARCVIEIETDWRCRRTILQQARPSGKVRKIEQCFGTCQADLSGEDCSIFRTGSTRDNRSDIAEHCSSEVVGQLRKILMPGAQGKRVLSCFG